MSDINPLKGWLLERSVRLDERVPGFAGAVLRASDERRQVIAAFLSRPHTGGHFADQTHAAQFLLTAGHDDILVAAFGSSPPGLRGALRRSGFQAHGPRFYRYLHCLLTSDRRPEMIRLIRELPRVTPERLKIARALAPDLRLRPIVTAARRIEQARDLTMLIALLEMTGLDRKTMVSALSHVKDLGDLRGFARRWSLKIDLPSHPVPAAHGYEPVTTGMRLKQLGREFRNCMSSYIASVMEGRSAFAVVEVEAARAVAHLRLRDGTWELEDVFGPENEVPPANCEELAETYLQSHGVHRRLAVNRVQKWACLRRMAGHVDYHVYDP